ncbi:MAG TPA: 30S ribosomal protein S17 [Dehalococcoidales bacterium]|nr:30S ribosomal protein S17 [Dehalococcoidales bacterium]
MAGKHKERIGQVISDKMAKTVVVEVQVTERHPLYNKNINKSVKYKVHDENKVSKIGDTVRIVETRPLSRDKRWRVAEVITKGEVVEIKPAEVV